MGRVMAAVDRLAALIAGLALLAGGLIAIGWATGWPAQWVSTLPEQVSTDGLPEVTAHIWWPWAVGIGGVMAVLVALRWIAAHVRVPRHRPVTLPGSDAGGRLSMDLRTIAAAAADELAAADDFRDATGRVRRDRGATVLVLTATVEPAATVADAAATATDVCGQIVSVLGDSAPPARVHLHTPRRRRQARRVQ